MLTRPPHILVTTPESLYILLTAAKSREILRTVRHRYRRRNSRRRRRQARLASGAFTRAPRSAHRAAARAHRPLRHAKAHRARRAFSHRQRSARSRDRTNRAAPRTRSCRRSSGERTGPGRLERNVGRDLPAHRRSSFSQHRSTLIFVNTRRLAERVAHNLAELLGKDAVAIASRQPLAQAPPRRRKQAQGRRTSRARRHRFARAWHRYRQRRSRLPDRLAALDRGRSCSASAAPATGAARFPKAASLPPRAMNSSNAPLWFARFAHGDLDRIEIPEAPLDVLAQQIVATCALPKIGSEDDLFALVRRAYPYRNLERAQFDAIVEMLSEGIAARRGRYGAYLHRDRVNGRLRGRRGARLAAITSGGAIPDNALYHRGRASRKASSSAPSMKISPLKACAATSCSSATLPGAFAAFAAMAGSRRRRAWRRPNVPFWRGEAPGSHLRTLAQVADLRENSANSRATSRRVSSSVQSTLRIAQRIRAAVAWLKARMRPRSTRGAEQVVEYIVAGRAVLGVVPTQQTIVAERFFDESGGMQLVIHAPFGGRINKAWGLALRKRFCRSFNFELQAAATDNGLNISLSEQHSFPLADVFHFLHPATVAASSRASRPRLSDFHRALALGRKTRARPPPLSGRQESSAATSAHARRRSARRRFSRCSRVPGKSRRRDRIPDHPLVREAMQRRPHRSDGYRRPESISSRHRAGSNSLRRR